ncbi:MAG: acetoin utilization AcuB family protein [Deltaproteobacteria bacterium]
MFVGPRMKRDLVTVTPGTTLEVAARLLTAHRIHHLPVVEEGDRLAGIVSDTDLRKATLDGMFGGADRGDSGAPVTAGEIMTRNPVTLSPGDTLDDAMLVLSRERFGALPVVEEGNRLVGIVTKADILSALLATLDIEGVGVRFEVVLKRDLAEAARLVGALGELQVEVRSFVLAPHGEEGYAAFVRVATIDVASVRGRLREKGFFVGELADFYEG